MVDLVQLDVVINQALFDNDKIISCIKVFTALKITCVMKVNDQ